jgi:hypothetical protein
MTGDAEHTRSQRFGLPVLASLLGISNEGLSFWEILAITAFTIGTLTIMTFAAPFNDGHYFVRSGTLFAVGSGAWMGGGALGFLFGVPRYKSATDNGSLGTLSTSAETAIAFTPSTNLEQISDWLTKIIVGATLVQIQPIVSGFCDLCRWLAFQINQPVAAIFCGGMIIFFFFSGFLWGYLWCSIRIFREMVQLTARLQNHNDTLGVDE